MLHSSMCSLQCLSVDSLNMQFNLFYVFNLKIAAAISMLSAITHRFLRSCQSSLLFKCFCWKNNNKQVKALHLSVVIYKHNSNIQSKNMCVHMHSLMFFYFCFCCIMNETISKYQEALKHTWWASLSCNRLWRPGAAAGHRSMSWQTSDCWWWL